MGVALFHITVEEYYCIGVSVTNSIAPYPVDTVPVQTKVHSASEE